MEYWINVDGYRSNTPTLHHSMGNEVESKGLDTRSTKLFISEVCG